MKYETYVKRLSKFGQSATEAQVKRTQEYLDRMFHTSPSYHQVDIDGELTEAIINRTRNFDEKKIHFKHGYEIKIGSVVTFKGDKYLILEKDKDEIYTFGLMKRCNQVFKVEVDRERVLLGHDQRGKPKYDYIITYKDEPCIVSSKYYSSNENTQLPLPEGRLSILMKYQEAPNIKLNEEFNLYGNTYKIADIGYIRVENGIGVMEITAERVVSK